MILIWVVLSAIIGGVVVALRKFPETKKSEGQEFEELPSGLFQPLWKRWKKFSNRMGSFQSRMILSLFFFVLVTPLAVAVKVFSDPLRIKESSGNTFWLSKKESPLEIEEFRRQF